MNYNQNVGTQYFNLVKNKHLMIKFLNEYSKYNFYLEILEI